MKTLVLTLLSLLSSSIALADMPPVPPPPPAKTCVADKPCPVVAAPAGCKKDDPAPMTVVEIKKAESSLIGKTVRIASKLHKDPPGCTELECSPEVRCCNRCGAGVFLSDSPVGELRIDVTGGSPYACGGDDTGVCCGVVLGKAVVVTGTLLRPNGILSIAPASSCTP